MVTGVGRHIGRADVVDRVRTFAGVEGGVQELLGGVFAADVLPAHHLLLAARVHEGRIVEVQGRVYRLLHRVVHALVKRTARILEARGAKSSGATTESLLAHAHGCVAVAVVASTSPHIHLLLG